MPITILQNAVIAPTNYTISLSGLLSISGADLPEYLQLVGFDYDRYPLGSTGSAEILSGKLGSLSFTNNVLTFSYTDQGYYNAQLGYLQDLSLTTSSGERRSEYLGLYGYGTAGQADTSLLNKLTAMTYPVLAVSASDHFLGSINLIARQTLSAPAAGTTATPNGVAAVAQSFVGSVWSDDGCWAMVSNIATTAGASLPLTAMSPNSEWAPTGNGEWVVVYDSRAASATEQLTWQSRLRPGDVIDIAGFCANHITTVAEGYGFNAKTVDNRGASVNDGASDVIIAPALDANTALAGGYAQYVTIYRLDTPIVNVLSSLSVAAGASAAVNAALSCTDPAGKAITQYQVYDTGTAQFSTAQGKLSAHTAAGALTINADQLASLSYQADNKSGSDTIMVRAFNGSYWGDWQALQVTVGVTARAPVINAPSAPLVMQKGQAIALADIVSASSPDAAITSYTISDPGDGGHIELNGAVNLLGTVAPSPVQYFFGYGDKQLVFPQYAAMTYQVSAADFAKVRYVAGGVSKGNEGLTITATNAAGLKSASVDVPLASGNLDVHGITHFLAPGSSINLDHLYTVGLVALSDQVQLVNFDPPWGSDKPNASLGHIDLHGVRNGVSSSLANAGNMVEVGVADTGKLTYTVGTDDPKDPGQTISINILGSYSYGHAQPIIYSASAAQVIAAHTMAVAVDQVVPLTTLVGNLDGSQTVHPDWFYHIFDPQGGGSLDLHGAKNWLGKRAELGEYLVAGSELALLTYTGGSGGDTLLVAVSADGLHSWSPEIGIKAGSNVAASAQALPVIRIDGHIATGQAGDAPMLSVAFGAALAFGQGSVRIETADHQLVESFKSGDAGLAFANNVLTLHPDFTPVRGGAYNLVFDGSLFANDAGASFASTQSYRFAWGSAADQAPIGKPLIKGTALEGQTLTVDTSLMIDPDGLGALSYQWLADGTPINGAHASSLTLSADTAGHAISVDVSYIDGASFAEKVSSGATAIVGMQRSGGAGDEVFVSTQGSDVIDGGAGSDTVVFGLPANNYQVSTTAAGIRVALIGGAEVDQLSHIEVLRFTDHDWKLAAPTDTSAAQLYRLYQSAFDRTPDGAGMGYWMQQSAHGAALESIAAAFVHSDEWTRMYAGAKDNASLVDALYQHILHRAPDAAGSAYWTQILDAHAAPLQAVLVGISESPENQANLANAISLGILYQSI